MLFVALLKLKADVIKDMFQQDIAHKTCPMILLEPEKGLKTKSQKKHISSDIHVGNCQDMT